MIETGEKHQYQVKCKRCLTITSFKAKPEDIQAWQSGEKLIQKALPYLNTDTRELLISGICGTCYDDVFGREV